MSGGLSDRLLAALGRVGDVTRADTGSFVVGFGSTRASVQVVDLGGGLEVITVIQIVAVDVDNTDELRSNVEKFDATLSFGSLRRSSTDGARADVLLYYTFPAGTLDESALTTMLHIVLAAGGDAAAVLS